MVLVTDKKPGSVSRNCEDPCQSRSPGSARGVHIHQTERVFKMFSLRLPGEFYPQLFLQDELPAEPV